MRRPDTPTLALTPAQIRQTEDWEAVLREHRPWTPSTSVTPVRCATCGHWNTRTNWTCADCQLPLVARAA